MYLNFTQLKFFIFCGNRVKKNKELKQIRLSYTALHGNHRLILWRLSVIRNLEELMNEFVPCYVELREVSNSATLNKSAI